MIVNLTTYLKQCLQICMISTLERWIQRCPIQIMRQQNQPHLIWCYAKKWVSDNILLKIFLMDIMMKVWLPVIPLHQCCRLHEVSAPDQSQWFSIQNQYLGCEPKKLLFDKIIKKASDTILKLYLENNML